LRNLLIVCGPTASGKTDIAVDICLRIGGEVVSADSMQIYRGMDIGTAKPTPEEMRGVRHHLIGIADPRERYSVAAYREKAIDAIEGIFARGNTPVVCGGTGLYIDALTKPLGFSAQGDEKIRLELEGLSRQEGGKGRLHEMLRAADPESADRLHENDIRRVIRALEVYKLTGKTLSQHINLDKGGTGAYRGRLFALSWPRDLLYSRIDRRVDQMINKGLLDEVKALHRSCPPGNSTAMQGIGYKEIARALDGDISLETAIAQIKQATRNYAKRQLTWFRRDERVQWVDAQNACVQDISREIIARKDIA
jgi:tRNA dimethylallyltransferase